MMKFITNRALMASRMDRRIQSNVIEIKCHYDVSNVLYLKEGNKSRKKD